MANGKTFTVTEQLNSEEDFDALQEVTAELEQAEARIEELETKLANAVEALELALELADNGLVDFSKYGLSCDADINKHYRTTLAELSSVSCANSKGQDDE